MLKAAWIRHHALSARRRWVVVALIGLLCLIVLAGGATFAWAAHAQRAESAPPTPADLFMQSILQRDGKLGWHQLCPDLQAQIPMDELQQQAQQQKVADARAGVTLTMDTLGTHPQAKGGGAIHLYLVTARRPDGWQGQRVYVLQTRQPGCVEDVQNVDLPGAGAQ